MPTNLGEGLLILTAIVVGATLPILPVQILWINMTTAVLLGLTLAFERVEPGIMTRPPRRPDEPLLTLDVTGGILLVSLLLLTAAFWLFEHQLGRGVPVAPDRKAPDGRPVRDDLLGARHRAIAARSTVRLSRSGRNALGCPS